VQVNGADPILFRAVGPADRFRYRWSVTWEGVWNILKWVLAALAAGFIGQFGRSYALRLIERRRKGREPSENGAAAVPPEVQMERDRLEAQAKIEKKRAKAEVKRLKKSRESKTREED